MCGIAGFVADSSPGDVAHQSPARLEAEFSLVHRMCEVIRHRGPDDEGIHVEPGVGLGMRRLSIIDLAGGRQPMHNETRTIWIVFNGEIYNYRELRRELESSGHHFYTASDTESIVHAYEEWGEDAFRRLRGMFGLAIWDARQRTLLLARDRVGIKPLHYAQRNGRLYFGSEIKSLLAAGAVDPQVRSRRARPLPLLPVHAARRSIFENVEKLPPGHYLRWRDGRAEVRQYWQIAADETFKGSEAEAAEQLRAVLADAVRSHMISDVPLGAFLSGGVDSSAVVGLMARASSRPVKTFSIGFDEPEFDELEHARAVAQHFGTDHHEFVVRPDGLSILDRSDRAFRRAVRGFLGDPDVVRLGNRAATRHGGAVGRWRRRAVRRLRSLPPASARRAIRSSGDSRLARRREAGLAAAAARRSRQELPASRRPRIPTARYLDSVGILPSGRARVALFGRGPRCADRHRRADAGTAFRSSRRRCRCTAG